MRIPFSAISALVIVLTAEKVFAVCQDGSFGKDCKFKCKCATSLECGSDGECPGNKCSPGMFGPGCQFVDLVYHDAHPNFAEQLKDSNDSTCMIDTHATSLHVELVNFASLTWYRIVVGQSLNRSVPINVNTEINSMRCLNQRVYVVNEKTLDITCDRRPGFNQFLFYSELARNVCSVYISGGWNVAVHGRAQQSSNLCSDLNNCGPDNALDDNIDDDIAHNHCSSTNFQTTTPEWNLTFIIPHYIGTIVIYGSKDPAYSIARFTLMTYDANKAKTFTHIDSSNPTNNEYVIHVGTSRPVTLLSIKNPVYRNNKTLTLCEVRTFGDIVCPNGTYGIECAQCPCEVNDTCNVYTGECGSGKTINISSIITTTATTITATTTATTIMATTATTTITATTTATTIRATTTTNTSTSLIKCSPNCLNGLCYQNNGTCVSCPGRFFGDQCHTGYC